MVSVRNGWDADDKERPRSRPSYTTNRALKVEIAQTPDSERTVFVGGTPYRASETPTVGVRTPVTVLALPDLPVPAGYEDIEDARLGAEILVHPDGTADFLETFLFTCAPTTVAECEGAVVATAPPAFENAVTDLVGQLSFLPPADGRSRRLTLVGVAFHSEPPIDPLTSIGPINACQADCCGAVGGTPWQGESGIQCEMNDHGDQEVFGMRLMALMQCSMENGC